MMSPKVVLLCSKYLQRQLCSVPETFRVVRSETFVCGPHTREVYVNVKSSKERPIVLRWNRFNNQLFKAGVLPCFVGPGTMGIVSRVHVFPALMEHNYNSADPAWPADISCSRKVSERRIYCSPQNYANNGKAALRGTRTNGIIVAKQEQRS